MTLSPTRAYTYLVRGTATSKPIPSVPTPTPTPTRFAIPKMFSFCAEALTVPAYSIKPMAILLNNPNLFISISFYVYYLQI